MVAVRHTRIVAALFLASAVLAAASLALQVTRHLSGRDTLLGLVRVFDVNREANITSWYSASLLLIAALVLILIALAASSAGDARSRHWQVLALIFFYLSADETASVHEIVLSRLQTTIGMTNSADRRLLPWVVMAVPFVTRVRRRLLAVLARTFRTAPAGRWLGPPQFTSAARSAWRAYLTCWRS